MPGDGGKLVYQNFLAASQRLQLVLVTRVDEVIHGFETARKEDCMMVPL